MEIDHFSCLWGSSCCSFALNGYLLDWNVELSTPTLVNSISSFCLLPTLPYFSSCSLACFGCVFMVVARLGWPDSSGARCDSGSRWLGLSTHSHFFSFCKGVIWLMIATAAEVPPVVTSPSLRFFFLFVHLHLRPRRFWSWIWMVFFLSRFMLNTSWTWPCLNY